MTEATPETVSVNRTVSIGIDAPTIEGLTAAALKVNAPATAIISTNAGMGMTNMNADGTTSVSYNATFSWSEQV